MSSSMRDTYRKEELIYEEILQHYHPIISKLSYDLGFKLASQNCLNSSSLVEDAISFVGNIPRSNRYGEDHIDGTDTKTASVYWRNKKHEKLTWAIRNVFNKYSWLRVVMFNPIHDELAYFLIPMHDWHLEVTSYKTGKSSGITRTYNAQKDSYSGIDKYRVKSFKEICVDANELVSFSLPKKLLPERGSLEHFFQ